MHKNLLQRLAIKIQLNYYTKMVSSQYKIVYEQAINIFIAVDIKIGIMQKQNQQKVANNDKILHSPRDATPYCPIHHPISKLQDGARVNPLSYSVCLVSHCNASNQVLCPACRNSHNQHHLNKIVGVLDLKKLLQKLRDRPFTKAKQYLVQLVKLMESLEWINCFLTEIGHLYKKTCKSIFQLVETTQNTISEYAQCKHSVSAVLNEIQTFIKPRKFEKRENCGSEIKDQLFYSDRVIEFPDLEYVDYNPIQDQLDYSGKQIQFKENKRKQLFVESIKYIDEIKNYSLKIIEVVLTTKIEEESPNPSAEQVLKIKQEYQRLKILLSQSIKPKSPKSQEKVQENKSDKDITTFFQDVNDSDNVVRLDPETSLGQFFSPNTTNYSGNNFNINMTLCQSADMGLLNPQQSQNCQDLNKTIKQCQTTLKDYEQKFKALEERVQNNQAKHKEKLRLVENQKKKLEKQNQNFKLENKKIVKQVQQRLSLMKQYEKKLAKISKNSDSKIEG